METHATLVQGRALRRERARACTCWTLAPQYSLRYAKRVHSLWHPWIRRSRRKQGAAFSRLPGSGNFQAEELELGETVQAGPLLDLLSSSEEAGIAPMSESGEQKDWASKRWSSARVLV